MIRNRWPTEAEVEAHPDGRAGWWVLTWADGAPLGAPYLWQPLLFDGQGVLELSRDEGPPDVAYHIHKGRPVLTTLPEVAGRLASELPVDEVHSARVRDLLQEAGRAWSGEREPVLPATLAAVLGAAEPFVDPMAGQVEMERLRAAVVAWVAEGRPV